MRRARLAAWLALAVLVSCVAALAHAIDGSPEAPAPARRQAEQAARAEAMRAQLGALRDQVERFGGWDGIDTTLAPFRRELRKRLAYLRADQGYLQAGDFYFAREATRDALRDEWSTENARGAIIDFSQQLAERGIDLIYVPVPVKIELYPELANLVLPESVRAPLPAGIPVNPQRSRLMIQLLEAGVELVDVLAPLQAARADAPVPLWERSYHHPSGLGVRIAGDAIAERLARYELPGREAERFTVRERRARESGHLREPMLAYEVVGRDGSGYRHDRRSPVVVMGDSNVFVHGRGSWGSQIGRAVGLPIVDISFDNGGNTSHLRLARRGPSFLETRRVVVWIAASFSVLQEPWTPAALPSRR